VRDKVTKEKAPDVRDQIVQLAFQKGLILLGAGENALRISPPLLVDEEQADFAFDTLEAILTGIEKT